MSASCWAAVIVAKVPLAVLRLAAKPPVNKSALFPAIISSQLVLSTENCHW